MCTDRENESKCLLDSLVENIDRTPFQCSCRGGRNKNIGLESPLFLSVLKKTCLSCGDEYVSFSKFSVWKPNFDFTGRLLSSEIEGYEFDQKIRVCDSAFLPYKKNLPCKPAYQSLSINNQLILTFQNKLKNNSWICSIMCRNFSEEYSSLQDDFPKVCVETQKSKSKIIMNNSDILSVCTDEKGKNKWYRAILLPDKKYALIDVGIIIGSSKVLDVISCPDHFKTIPYFSCEILLDMENSVNINTDLVCKITIQSNDTFAVSGDINNISVIGLLKEWNFKDIHGRTNSSKNETMSWTSSDLPNSKFSNVQNKFPKTPAASSTITKTQRFKFENEDTIFIVNYVDSGDIYARYAGKEHYLKYFDVLNTIVLAGHKAPTLNDIPSKGSVFFLKHNNAYHRASFVRSLGGGRIRAHLQDWGTTIDVDTPDMKEMDSTHAQLPCYIYRISLAGSGTFRKYEPCDKILNFMKQAIKKETPFKLTFEKNMYPYVKLKCVPTCEDVNRFVSENTMPIFERLQRDNIKAYDLPVTMFHNVKTLDLTEFNNFPKPITLKLMNVLELPFNKRFTCSKFETHMKERIKVLSRQITEYCSAQPDHYLPRLLEMCLVLKEDEWVRAVAIEQKGNDVTVFFVDYGCTSTVPMTRIKKLVPYFVENVPILACICKIKNIPDDSPKEVWERVVEMLKNKDEIDVMSIEEIKDEGEFLVSVPDVIKVLKSENLL